MTKPILFIISISFCSVCQAGAPPCSVDAIAKAKQLLAFHLDENEGISIDDQVKELPSVRNPANAKQKFNVLEVWGHLYKGEYRMRFLYYNSKEVSCVLMGQEILEHAKL